jgi:hypothetical protein
MSAIVSRLPSLARQYQAISWFVDLEYQNDVDLQNDLDIWAKQQFMRALAEARPLGDARDGRLTVEIAFEWFDDAVFKDVYVCHPSLNLHPSSDETAQSLYLTTPAALSPSFERRSRTLGFR